jgi:hypothetical protein
LKSAKEKGGYEYVQGAGGQMKKTICIFRGYSTC